MTSTVARATSPRPRIARSPALRRAGARKAFERFGCEVSDARASTVAAIRETFEETGVLLTRPPHDVVSDVDAGLLADRRRQVEAHEVAFTALLDELGLAVDADLIRPWAHWIAPAAEPRRYDTFFYVAALPSGRDRARRDHRGDRSGLDHSG